MCMVCDLLGKVGWRGVGWVVHRLRNRARAGCSVLRAGRGKRKQPHLRSRARLCKRCTASSAGLQAFNLRLVAGVAPVHPG